MHGCTTFNRCVVLLVQYMFVTEVDTTKKRGVHDEMARLLVQYLKQHSSTSQLKLLDVSHGSAPQLKLLDVSHDRCSKESLSPPVPLSLSLSLSPTLQRFISSFFFAAFVVLPRSDSQEHGAVPLCHKENPVVEKEPLS